jgi:hypothetical protein
VSSHLCISLLRSEPAIQDTSLLGLQNLINGMMKGNVKEDKIRKGDKMMGRDNVRKGENKKR